MSRSSAKARCLIPLSLSALSSGLRVMLNRMGLLHAPCGTPIVVGITVSMYFMDVSLRNEWSMLDVAASLGASSVALSSVLRTSATIWSLRKESKALARSMNLNAFQGRSFGRTPRRRYSLYLSLSSWIQLSKSRMFWTVFLPALKPLCVSQMT